jgi:hypothetical protein
MDLVQQTSSGKLGPNCFDCQAYSVLLVLVIVVLVKQSYKNHCRKLARFFTGKGFFRNVSV